jgi:hypothetical protein
MKFTGRENVHLYDASTVLRQVPLLGPRKWQDSTWLQWWDIDSGVGGVHRIGHEYNLSDGVRPHVAAWSNLITPKGVFKQVKWLPLREQDKLARGWGGGDETLRQEYIDGEHVWLFDDPQSGVSCDLRFKDYYLPFRSFPSSGKSAETISAEHIDVAGRLRGSVTMGGQTYRVEGQGFRDHGWGYRDVNLILSHRYVTGAFGPDLSFCCYAIHNASSNTVETFGFVAKGSTVHFAKKIDLIAYVENDSSTTRGGRIEITLADGEMLDVELTSVAPGIMCNVHNMWNNNTLCSAAYDGRVGSGMFETSMNFHQGTRKPGKMIGNLLESGYYAGAAAGRAVETDEHYIKVQTL